MVPKTPLSPSPSSSSTLPAHHLKATALSRLKDSSYKSALKYARRARRLDPSLPGISLIITALKVLRLSPDDHYSVLRLSPFSSPSAIRSQYKTLVSSFKKLPGLEEAVERVEGSFRFLMNRGSKRMYDEQLRGEGEGDTFWTGCATCRILHEFDRRYIGHRLICPSCQKSFLAVEVKEEEEEGVEDDDINVRDLRVTGVRSRTKSRPRVPNSWGSSVKKRKIEVSASSDSKKPKVRKEKTLAEMQLEIAKARAKQKEKVKNEKSIVSLEVEEDMSIMTVEDSDFYDFDKDRTEKSFVRGQIWAIYDDDDGMPRHYGLIEDVRSSNPFGVKMCWLDVQNNGDEALVLWENSGHHVSCGKFKVGRRVDIDSVNFFSHLVECERAAKELYRIYPKKGSVWALYRDGEGRCYDIVVFLTSYSEMYGLSMAHLQKVEGYKTIFKRREIGAHAVAWLEKEDARLFSHQIPARKLSDEEDEHLPRECWELDPASLPSELLCINWGRKNLMSVNVRSLFSFFVERLNHVEFHV